MSRIMRNTKFKNMTLFFIFIFLTLVLASCEMFSDTKMFEVVFSVEGEGKIELEKSDEIRKISDEKYKFTRDSVIKLTARPDTDWEFEHWKIDDYITDYEKEFRFKVEQDNIKIAAVFSEKNTGSLAGEVDVKHNFPFAGENNILNSSSSETAISGNNNINKRNFTEKNNSKIQENNEELIIGYNKELSPPEIKSKLQNRGYEVIKIRPELAFAVVKAGETDKLASDKLSILTAESDIRYAEPNYRFYTQGTKSPNDEFFNKQWHYPLIRLPQAWNQTTGDSSVTVAVLDTGVNTDHPDLGKNIIDYAGYNVLEDNYDWQDNNGHGTHVAGTISADTDNTLGAAGVLWDSSLVPVKVLGDDGMGDLADIAAGIYYAAGLGEESLEDEDFSSLPENPRPADIINLSLGGDSGSQLLRETVEKAVKAGVIIVAAAGNKGNNKLMYPAAYEEVISVGAVDFNYPDEPEMPDYSNYSSELDVLAPGGDTKVDSNNSGDVDGILSTGLVDEGYNYPLKEGTSMAAPHVSGVLGLMLAEGIPAFRAREVLNKTSMELKHTEYGSGLLNAYWAINEVNKISLFLQNDQGEIEKEKDICLTDKEFKWDNIVTGKYKVKALIDVKDSGKLEPGDYFAESERIEIEKGDEIDISLLLEEYF